MSTEKAILQFAKAIDLTSSSIIPDLRARIPSLPLKHPPEHPKAFDAKGIELFNLGTRHTRGEGLEQDDLLKACLLRVFAFGMIDSAALSRKAKKQNADKITRMLRAAFKTLRVCVECGELEFAGKVAQRAAHWLEQAKGEVPEDLRTRLEAGYYVWRLALAWKQDKLDFAEMMYEKIGRTAIAEDPNIAEDLGDVLYELGKDLCEKRLYELAASWLERAFEVLDRQELDQLSDDAGESRLAIMQQLVKAHLKIGTDESLDKAKNIASLIEGSHSDKVIAWILRLEILNSEKQPDAAEYSHVLRRMVRMVTMTRSNFKTIMHHIHKLKKLSAELAGQALDELIALRLGKDGGAKEEWVERACLMRLWIETSLPPSRDGEAAMKEVLDTLQSTGVRHFSGPAAHAAQTLLWKQIGSAYDEKRFDAAERYCELASHALFDKSGELNKAKIMRKFILSAISRGDEVVAREVYYRIPSGQQNAPQTQHLMYRVALMAGDKNLAAECLDMVAQRSPKDSALVYACVLDAQRLGDQGDTLAALLKVLERYDHKAPKEVNLAALLRCAIRLIQQGHLQDPSANAVESLCGLFQGAAEHAYRSPNVFNEDEIEWFSKNCYNLALQHVATAHPAAICRLAEAGKKLVELLARGRAQETYNLQLRLIVCEYLFMTAMVVLARAEDNVAISMDQYLLVSKHAEAVRSLIAEQMKQKSLGDAAKKDLVSKHIQSIKFDLEASLRLNKWDKLEPLFSACFMHEDPKRWATLADLAFNINEELCARGEETRGNYQPKVLRFIQQIISRSYHPGQGTEKLAAWIRCLFDISIAKDDKVAEHTIAQAISIAERCKGTAKPYPEAELEWLAATAFNHAVTCFCVKDDKNCQLWAEKALMLASAAEDGGELAKVLEEKYRNLTFGQEE